MVFGDVLARIVVDADHAELFGNGVRIDAFAPLCEALAQQSAHQLGFGHTLFRCDFVKPFFQLFI